jgi:hypothetical protein
MTLSELDRFFALAAKGRLIPTRYALFTDDEVDEAVSWTLCRDRAIDHLTDVCVSFLRCMDEFELAPALFRCAVQHKARLMGTDIGDDIDAIMTSWQHEDLRIRGCE